jgi:muramoyltetrapeptide carboxypeptidase
MTLHDLAMDIQKTCATLRAGDIVDIIAPSSRNFTQEQVNQAIALLAVQGLVGRIPDDLVNTVDPFSSNTLEYRLAHLKRVLAAKDSRAIWVIRGGYGATQLLPGLQAMTPPDTPKRLLGFSDVTALHLFFNQQWHWPSLHSKVLTQVIRHGQEDDDVKLIFDLLLGRKDVVTYIDLVPLNEAAKRPQALQSTMIGGNLAVLMTSMGTPWQLNATGKILLLEDVDERGYRVDRMLFQLAHARCLEGATAVCIGDMWDEDGKQEEQAMVMRAIERFAVQHTLPIYRIPFIGHQQRNRPVPLASPATLTMEKGAAHATLTVASGGRKGA